MFVYLALLLFFIPSFLYAQPTNIKAWNTAATISSDTLTVDCAELLRPIVLGRLLVELDPINVPGEMDEALRSAHPIKVSLQPESGTSDSLSTISGCSLDGEMLWLSTTDTGDSITVVHTPNVLELNGAANLTLSDPDTILVLTRHNSKWVQLFTFSGSGGGSTSRVITGATGVANAFEVTDDGTNGCRIYVSGGQPIFECYQNTTDPASIIIDPKVGQSFFLNYNGIQGIQVDSSFNVTLSNNARETHTFALWGGGAAPDGTNCIVPSAPTTVGSGGSAIPVWGMVCSDSDAATMVWHVPMPGAWDTTTTVRFWGYQYNVNATPSGSYRLDWSVGCQGHSEQLILSTEDTDSQMVFNYASGFSAYDLAIASTNDITPGGLCAQHDMLVIRAQVNAASTTAAVAGVLNVAFKATYTVNSWDD